MVMPIPLPTLITLMAALLMAAGLLGILVALVSLHQPLWGIPAAVAVILGASILFTGPVVQPPPIGSPLRDYGGEANFQQQWNAYRDQYGEPVGTCGDRNGILVCWTKYARIEFHPEEPNPYYRIANGNVGSDLAESRHIEWDSDPTLAPIVVAYQAAEAARGVDWLYWYGYPRTNAREDGDRSCQYFDKALLCWRTGSDDPSDVKKELVGALVWSIEHRGVDTEQPNQWTPARQYALIGSLGCLLVSALPFILPGVFRRQAAYSDLN